MHLYFHDKKLYKSIARPNKYPDAQMIVCTNLNVGDKVLLFTYQNKVLSVFYHLTNLDIILKENVHYNTMNIYGTHVFDILI